MRFPMGFAYWAVTSSFTLAAVPKVSNNSAKASPDADGKSRKIPSIILDWKGTSSDESTLEQKLSNLHQQDATAY